MKILLSTFLLLISLSLSAQTYVDIPWREGILKVGGKEQVGKIRLGGDLGAPWLNHTKVYFVPQELFGDDHRPKNKLVVEYAPEEIDGYSTHTMDKEGNRVEMNFVTMELLVQKSLSKKLEMVFMRQIESGPVNILTFTPAPPKDYVSTTEQRYADGQAAINRTICYLQKGDGELIPASECDLMSYLSECPAVITKMKNEEYGFKSLEDRPQRKGLGKLIADSVGDNELELRICNAVKEYNMCVE